ncbi:FG-GAP repeat domain-containing protein [Bacteroidota bacterium]
MVSITNQSKLIRYSGILGLLCLSAAFISCGPSGGKTDKGKPGSDSSRAKKDNIPVASRISTAKSSGGQYISWKEHLIDGPDISGVALSGSDGLTMGDLDLDGYLDIVSVHEADTVYDDIPRGYIRLAFGSENPDQWELATLAEGSEAGAAEDITIGDINNDGWPDIIAACELAHLIYFQNPGKEIRSGNWERKIPSVTLDRGSYIRVFCADFNGNGQLEVTAPNKGSQHPGLHTSNLHPISWFEINGDPLDGSWTEHVLTRVDIPENSRPVDLDGDGDLDILGGSRGEERIMWFENLEESTLTFREHPINILKDGEAFPVTGVMVDFEDFNKDGRLDIVVFESPRKRNFGWIEQPDDPSGEWNLNLIGTISPDQLMGVVIADINSDGNPDIMTGGYSSSPRKRDGDKTVNDALGRLAWFEHPGNAYDPWIRHDVSRRIRAMFDQFVPLDLDEDGDIDFVTTRGNSYPYDGVLWLEQVRSEEPLKRFIPARDSESREMGLPDIK